MQRVSLFGFAVLLIAPILSAQSEKPPAQAPAANAQTMTVITHPDGTWTTTTATVPVEVLCPVTMEAKQGTGGGLIKVRGKDDPKATGPSQRIHLVVSDAKTAKVTGARVRVYGLSGRNRMLNTASGLDTPDMTRTVPDMTRTVEATFAPDGKNQAAADLVLPGFTAVTRVVMKAIDYDDGSTWTPAGHQSCSVAPDRMMLVAGR